MRAWIQTYTGQAHDLENPDPTKLSPRDIAHALAQICRFTGHSARFYSVAQHCVLVSRMLPMQLKLSGLLHDAAEAYVTDVSSPLKRLLGEPYARLEHLHEKAIAKRWNLMHPWSPEVRQVDMRMVLTEARDLLGPAPAPWGLPAKPYPKDVLTISAWVPKEAEERWIWAYEDLTNELVTSAHRAR